MADPDSKAGWLLRRVVLAPAMPVLAAVAALLWVVVLVTSVLGCPPVALIRGRRPRWRALRVVSMALAYLLVETLCVLVCLLLWLGSGCGLRLCAPWSVRAHAAVLAAFLGVLLRVARAVFGFRVLVEEPERHPEDVRRVRHEAPLVVLARHAGPGASFALVHLLVSRYARHPHVVLTDRLRLDPAIDLLLTRTGCTWVSDAGPVQATRIGAAASGLKPGQALLLFPEGADWTPVRHLRAVARLRQRGLVKQAQLALQMPHVLPPHPAGTVAAVRGAPTADVLVFTHAGHDALLDAASAWRALPLVGPLRMAWWRAAASEVPREDEQAATRWLQQIWVDIDAWVGEQTALSDLGAQRSRTTGWP